MTTQTPKLVENNRKEQELKLKIKRIDIRIESLLKSITNFYEVQASRQ